MIINIIITIITVISIQGCIGFCGTNARPSIAPTFGVEPMLGKKEYIDDDVYFNKIDMIQRNRRKINSF
jgi:hypothetical protein